MGLVVARPNDLGVRGVAPLAQFSPTRGLSEAVTEAQISVAYSLAQRDNVDVHVNSWGFVDNLPHPIVEAAIQAAADKGRSGSGMVIVFATGNDGVRLNVGEDLSTLPFVIGVGASNANDIRSSFSNFGPTINIVAPSNDFANLPGMVTTDNEDDAGFAEPGYNDGGFDDFGFPNLDQQGKYTQDFGGTSAACPVVSGVAALILSVNSQLKATQVRLILEHTADPVSPQDAQYNGITSRSEKYGYGRVNASKAVAAAVESTTNGNKGWPERATRVAVDTNTNTITWSAADTESSEFLVVESDNPDFSFIPVDGACYFFDAQQNAQSGCQTSPITDLPDGVSVLFAGTANKTSFLLPGGRKFFGLYSRNSLGRYSFGVAIDSDGNVFDPAPDMGGGGGDNGGDTGGDTGGAGRPPRVTINVTPLTGESPLEVSFQGNALIDSNSSVVEFCCLDCNGNGVEDARDIENGTSADTNLDGIPDECPNDGIDVDMSKLTPCQNPLSPTEAVRCTGWDFETDGVIDTAETTTTHLYEALSDGDAQQKFRATLTFTDSENRKGSQFVDILVSKSASSDGNNGQMGGDTALTLSITAPNSGNIEIDSGTAPLSVQLKVDASSLPGTFQRVFWDLGDGATATSLSVAHTYQNTSDGPIIFPITVTVFTTVPSQQVGGGFTQTSLLTVQPEVNDTTNLNLNGFGGLPPTGNGTGAPAGCGSTLGLVPALMMMLGLALLRRKWVSSRF